ncbi:MAG: VIT domain-containing protein [Hormoscilla sp.]
MKLKYIIPATTILLAATTNLYGARAQGPTPSSPRLTAEIPKTPWNAERPVGGLSISSPEKNQQVFPLKHTEVKAKVAGNVGQVEVTQRFANPYTTALEAVYVFPLPDNAGVHDMEIKIGDRRISGDIKKRDEAREIYERAREEGRTAGLLEQERDNIFTQSLANIKPGEEIEVTIRYTENLEFAAGDYEFVFPMVVGPRYIPGDRISGSGGDSSRVPDGSRINPPVLPPGMRSGHDINVTVEIDAGVPITGVRSPSHKIVTQGQGETLRVQLAKTDRIPNKDLILRYRVAGENTQGTVLTQADRQGGHFAAYLIPAISYGRKEIVPKDVVFLIDTSGSQRGDPLAKCQELMRQLINDLHENDTFTIIDFANATTALSTVPLANTRANRAQALEYINQLKAKGGTELMNGINTVLNLPAAPGGRLRSIVLLTDGYIGNENEIIAQVQQGLQPGNRLYSFGVGSSVNRFLLNRLAEVGRGTSQVIRQDEPTREVAEEFARKINNPVLTNIQISWEGSGVQPEIYPTAAPDLFAEQPLVILGRKGDRASGNLRITGVTAGGRRYNQVLAVNFNGDNQAIAQLWGRARIKELMNQMFGGETKTGVEAVTKTALAYQLLSPYTAFVAVSEEVRVNPDGTRQRVQVPVELPEGVSYEGIYGTEARGNQVGGQFSPPSAPSSAITVGGGSRGAAPGPLAQSSIFESEDELAPENHRIEVISALGLDAGALASLTRELAWVDLPSGVSGEIVFEFRVSNGQVGRIILDDTVSTLQAKAVLDEIRQTLAIWNAPRSVSGNVRLQLRIKP